MNDRKPNIILIVADDISAKRCTFLPEGKGRAIMPTLERLAREGTVLGNLHTPSPICTPSRFALMTGTYPGRARNPDFLARTKEEGQTVVEFNTEIMPGQGALPERLRAAGYATGMVGKGHMVHLEGFVRLPYLTSLDEPGVQATLDQNAARLQAATHACGFDYAERLYFGNVDADGIEPLAAHNQEWITEGALHFIEQHHDQPFFLYMASTIPHGPTEPERSWRNPHSVTPTGLQERIPAVQASRTSIDDRLRAAGLADDREAAAVLWLDDAVTALMDKLEALHLADNTIVIFVSDHGTAAKGGLYDGGTRTPGLVWRKGGFSAGGTIHSPSQHIDWAPTIMEWAGIPVEKDTCDGTSLAPVLEGAKQPDRTSLYFELGYSRAIIKDGFKYIALRYPDHVEHMPLAERAARLKESNDALIARGRPITTTDPAAPFSHLFLIPGGHDVDRMAIQGLPGFFDRDQLYDLAADPGEQHNLANNPDYAERLNDLKAELAVYVSRLPASFGEFGKAGHSPSTV